MNWLPGRHAGEKDPAMPICSMSTYPRHSSQRLQGVKTAGCSLRDSWESYSPVSAVELGRTFSPRWRHTGTSQHHLLRERNFLFLGEQLAASQGHVREKVLATRQLSRQGAVLRKKSVQAYAASCSSQYSDVGPQNIHAWEPAIFWYSMPTSVCIGRRFSPQFRNPWSSARMRTAAIVAENPRMQKIHATES